MKVYITTSGPFPNGDANASRIKCYAKGLQEQHIECEVLTTSHRGSEICDIGFTYKRIGKNSSNMHLLVRMVVFVRNTFLLRKYLKENIKREDVILIYHNGIVEDSILLTLNNRCHLVRELCEVPYYDDKLVSKVMRWFQLHYFFKKFEAFIAISEPLKELAEKYKRLNAKVIKIPILVDKEKFVLPQVIKIQPIETNYIFHSGSLTELKDGLIGMIEAIADVNKRGYNIHLYSTGSISINCELWNRIHSLNIENKIHFLGFLHEQELREYQMGSMLFVVNKLDTLQNRYCFATKLGEYLSTQKPVIMTDVGEANCFLQNNKSAYIIKAGNSTLIADKIIEAMKNSDNRLSIGKKGYDVARNNFCYDVQGIVLLDLFTNLN